MYTNISQNYITFFSCGNLIVGLNMTQNSFANKAKKTFPEKFNTMIL